MRVRFPTRLKNCIYRRSCGACTANERDSSWVSERKTINLSTRVTQRPRMQRETREKKMCIIEFIFSNSSFDDVRPECARMTERDFVSRSSQILHFFFVSFLVRSRDSHIGQHIGVCVHRHPNGGVFMYLEMPARMCALFEQKFVSIEYIYVLVAMPLPPASPLLLFLFRARTLSFVAKAVN